MNRALGDAQTRSLRFSISHSLPMAVGARDSDRVKSCNIASTFMTVLPSRRQPFGSCREQAVKNPLDLAPISRLSAPLFSLTRGKQIKAIYLESRQNGRIAEAADQKCKELWAAFPNPPAQTTAPASPRPICCGCCAYVALMVPTEYTTVRSRQVCCGCVPSGFSGLASWLTWCWFRGWQRIIAWS